MAQFISDSAETMVDSRTKANFLRVYRDHKAQPREWAKARRDQNVAFYKRHGLDGGAATANADAIERMYEGVMRDAAKKSAQDSLISNGGMFQARELEYQSSELLRRRYQMLSGLELFRVDSSIPPGYKTFTQNRLEHNSEWGFYRGNGDNIPAATGVSLSTETGRIIPAVSGIRYNFFEEMSFDLAAFSVKSELEFAAQRGADEFVNRLIWSGSDVDQLLGVVNSPFTTRSTGAVAYGSSTPADAILEDLQNAASDQHLRTGGAGGPTRMIMALTPYTRLSQRKRAVGSSSDQTILQAFAQDNMFITQIAYAPELDGAGPGGSDVIVFDRPDSFRIVMPRGLTMLPIQEHNFGITIPMYLLFGGVKNYEALDTRLHFVGR